MKIVHRFNSVQDQRLTIKEARIQNGYSLEEVADYVGIQEEELDNYETKASGAMPFELAIKLSKLYEMTFDQLVFE